MAGCGDPDLQFHRTMQGLAPLRAITQTVAVPVPSCTLELKVIPNAPRNEIAGWLGSALKVKIHAPALDGRANDALCAFLAEKLGVPRRAITLLRGEKSRQKIIRIAGLGRTALESRLR